MLRQITFIRNRPVFCAAIESCHADEDIRQMCCCGELLMIRSTERSVVEADRLDDYQGESMPF